ncbi:MAG: peptide chain release factor 2 [SAR202 cluster bacterium]|nr:peptide chain release factor 2 [SAR202 cluster bacterium]
MQELKGRLAQISDRISDLRCVFDLDSKEREVEALEHEKLDPAFWTDSRKAQEKMRTLAAMRAEVDDFRNLNSRVAASRELLDMAVAEGDTSLSDTLSAEIAEIAQKLDSLEFKLMLSGEYDRRNAILAIHAGAGGVESQDWVGMLMRMFLRWAERKGIKTEVLDLSEGEEGGIKSVTIQFTGDYAYGYLRSERGVHRLVRISPFDADHARHTSFALAEVLPEAEEGADVTIDPKDIQIDVFRAGGAGGQNVQKTSTAVRITHLPTGIKVSCQNERSQLQNKQIAMRILLSRLVERQMQERARELAKLKGEHISAEWGNQIRSYVLHPYKMVKDHRTAHETSDAEGVLEGDLDGFITAYLKSTMGE